MTRTNKILLAVVAVGLAVGAFYFLALAPKREEIAKLDTDVAAKEAELTQAQQMLAGYEQARKTYKSQLHDARAARQGRACRRRRPLAAWCSSRAQPSAAASTSRRSSSARGLAGASGATPAPGDEQSTGGELAAAPGAVPVAGGAMSAMPFSFTFNGSYFDLSSFMSRLEHFVTVNNERVNVTGRLLRLESVSIAPSASRLPADAGRRSARPPTSCRRSSRCPAPTHGAAPAARRRDPSSTPPTTTANAGAAQ